MAVHVDTLIREVHSPRTTYLFECEAYRSTNKCEYLIDSDFYEKHAGAVPEAPHHELMLTRSPVYGRVNPDIPIHVYHHVAVHKHFVCWVHQVKFLSDARFLYDIWCAGTVYSIEHNEDFAAAWNRNSDDFLGFLRKVHEIEIVR